MADEHTRGRLWYNSYAGLFAGEGEDAVVVAEVAEVPNFHIAHGDARGPEAMANARRIEACWNEYDELRAELDRMHDALVDRDQKIMRLQEALQAAYEHVSELREAWERGAMREGDGQGGTRSNRNMDVCVALRAALSRPESAILAETEATDA